jgi:hypothetical protein
MLGRRSALLGLLGMGGMTGPALAMRPTSQQPSSIVTVGLAGGPQVIIDSTANIPVTTIMQGTGLAASDVTAISNLRNVVRMPTGLAAEASPGLMGPVQVTYTDASVADGVLTLDGIMSGGPGLAGFTLHLSSNNTGTRFGGVITGRYQFVGGSVILSPLTVMQSDTFALGFYVPTGGVRMKNLAGAALIPNDEIWHNMGSTGLAGDGGVAQYQITGDSFLHLSIHKSFTALGALTSATFANLLPVAYTPPASRLTGGVPVATDKAEAGTRLTITAATGAVNLVNLPSGATLAGCDVRIPLT